MKAQDKKQLKEWWKNCPSKRIVYIVNAIQIIFGEYCIYELGYGVGKFLAHLGF